MPLNPSVPKSASGDGVSIENEVGQTLAIDDNGASLTVDGPLTDAELRATAVPISGTVTANAGTGPFPVNDNGGSLTVDGPLTDAELRATPVEVTTGAVATATLTNVAGSATSVTLLASNANRKMATFYNDSNQDLRIKFGATASATSFTVLLDTDSYYEMPLPIYTGVIDGIWDSANGAVRITELA